MSIHTTGQSFQARGGALGSSWNVRLLLRAFCCPLGAPSSWMSFPSCLQPVDFGQTTHIVTADIISQDPFEQRKGEGQENIAVVSLLPTRCVL